ncbi:hypothetical protein MKEN_01091600 [Mycena kentingensis (nom. inval.)]|nr:hypothetical protein MKEN_01091600 [Mycena kentingensis (nom. inval.)]
MVLTTAIRKPRRKDRVLHYSNVTFNLLKDIGNASNQPYLQAIASVSLLIVETVQRVDNNKDACMKMTERAHELVCAIINICRDSEAQLSTDMERSVQHFLETLEKILQFVRSQVKGSFMRRMLRSMEDADLIVECNSGLKHALDVFSVQSGIIAAKTMAEMQKEAKVRHEELVRILEEKKTRRSARKSKLALKTEILPPAALLPASPKIYYGRDEELKHVVELIVDPKPPPAVVVPTTPVSPWATWSPSTPSSPYSSSFSSTYRPLTPSSTTFSYPFRSQTPTTPPATPPATPKKEAPVGPARICIYGPAGIGKTALALAATHHARVQTKFGVKRYFIECEGAEDPRGLVECMGRALGLEREAEEGKEKPRISKKHIVNFLTGRDKEKEQERMRRKGSLDSTRSNSTNSDAGKDTQLPSPPPPTPARSDSAESSSSSATAASGDSDATLADGAVAAVPEKKEPEPILLILDGLDRVWKPHVHRNDVEDFLSLLADIQHLTLLVTLRGNERPRQIKWTRPFLPPLKPLLHDAAQATFLDISDVPEDDPDLQEVLNKIALGCPKRLTMLANLASFEGCGALVRRWEVEGENLLNDRTPIRIRDNAILGGVVYDEPETIDVGEFELPEGLSEDDVWAVLDPTTRSAVARAFPALIPAPLSDASSSSSSSGKSTPELSRSNSIDSSVSSSLNSAFSSSASTAANSRASRRRSNRGSIFSSMFTPSRSSSKDHGRFPSIDSVVLSLPSPPTTPPISRVSLPHPTRKQSEATPAALARLQSPALHPPTPTPASMQRWAGLVTPTGKIEPDKSDSDSAT